MHIMDSIRKLLQELEQHQWLAKILIALVVALLGIWLAKRLANALERVLMRFHTEAILSSFLGNVCYAAGIIVVCIAAMDFAGIPTTSLIALLGAAGIAIGLAMKDSLSNIASGVMLIVLRPFKSGDYVQVANMEGTVDSVNIFQTHLHTVDNREIILPNSQITAVPIINFTVRGTRRLDVNIKIQYQDDLSQVRELLLQIVRSNKKIFTEPAPEVAVVLLADSHIEIQLRAWVSTADYGALKSSLLEQCWLQLNEKGFKAAYPQRHMHIHHHGKPATGVNDDVIASL
jgi:small conductance mechanosensitive channel